MWANSHEKGPKTRLAWAWIERRELDITLGWLDQRRVCVAELQEMVTKEPIGKRYLEGIRLGSAWKGTSDTCWLLEAWRDTFIKKEYL